MPTLGTQNISTSYPQLLKTFGTGGLDGTLQVVTDGDNTSSALSVSTSGVASTGTFEVVGTSLLTGAVTFGTSFTASTGTATIGAAVIGATTFTTGFTSSTGTNTLGTATIGTASIGTATIGATVFTTGFTSSTGTNTLGTATIGTASIGTASIGTATIGTVSGATIFTTGFTSSTGTNTLGTIASTTISNTGLATVGTLEIGASGPNITKVSYGTAAFTLSTVAAHNGAGTTNGTVALTGTVLGDMVIGSLDSLGSATGSTGLIIGFHTIGSDVVRFSITNPTGTAGTVPAGTLQMAALRFTA